MISPMGWNAFFCCSQFDIVKKDDILSAANILKHCQNEVRSKLLILTTNRTYVCQSQLFLLALLSALRPVETSSCLAPDDVPATEHSASPVLRRGTVCRPTFVLHQHCLLSKTGLRLICFCIRFWGRCCTRVYRVSVAFYVMSVFRAQFCTI